ncbi:MAG: hypothetical protein ACRED2_01265 [Methylocella sp.]
MQVDGVQLLDEIEAAYKHHIVMHESGVLAIAVWCVFAHVYREFDHSPRLGLRYAAEKRRSLKSPKSLSRARCVPTM